MFRISDKSPASQACPSNYNINMECYYTAEYVHMHKTIQQLINDSGNYLCQITHGTSAHQYNLVVTEYSIIYC